MAVLTTFALDGKTALVTGARRGIGAAMALGLAEAGADIIAVSTSMTADGGDLGERVRALGRDCTGIACDLSDRSALMAMVEQLADRRIDILVNNAGTIERAPATEHTDALWDRVIDVNLSAPFVLTREIGRQMVARGSGKVIFTASLLSFQGGITVPGYAASKGGIAQLAKAFANEWAAHGVNVNAIAPGVVDGEHWDGVDAFFAKYENKAPGQKKKEVGEAVPFGRMGTAEDLTGMAIFLASPEADYIVAQTYNVDGGNWMS